MKLIIAGSREAGSTKLVALCFQQFKHKGEVTEIVDGDARGIDRFAGTYATQIGLISTKMPADWIKHPRYGGYLRNGEMAIYADALLAIWDGVSKGTRDMIKKAIKRGLYVEVYNVFGELQSTYNMKYVAKAA